MYELYRQLCLFETFGMKASKCIACFCTCLIVLCELFEIHIMQCTGYQVMTVCSSNKVYNTK